MKQNLPCEKTLAGYFMLLADYVVKIVSFFRILCVKL